MKKTYNQLSTYISLSNKYVAKKEAEKNENKLTYAIIKVGARLTKLMDRIQEDANDVNVDHCMTDERTGAILKDENKELKYTKEGLRARNLALKNIFGETEYEIEPYYCTAIPNDLTQFEKEIMSGIVIDPEKIKID